MRPILLFIIFQFTSNFYQRPIKLGFVMAPLTYNVHKSFLLYENTDSLERQAFFRIFKSKTLSK